MMLRLLMVCCSLLVALSAVADPIVDSVSIGAGAGVPNRLRGVRVAVQKDWQQAWLSSEKWQLTGYWDFSTAYWHTDKNAPNWAFAVAPTLRYERKKKLPLLGAPFIEGSIGVSYLTRDVMGRRDLGSHFNFEDLIGFGSRFGRSQQYEISYHFLHYSNAGLAMPNEGVDVKALITFRYYFTDKTTY